MFSFKSKIVKIVSGVIATIIISFLAVQSAIADDGAILMKILANTYHILAAVNSLPSFIANWISPDTSPATASLQSIFSNASTGYISQYNMNAATTQNKLLTDFFGKGSAAPQNVNDLSYTSLLGNPFISPDPRKDNSIDPAYNYAKNAAGLSITHPAISGSWIGKKDAISRYINYYNTVTSVQSFDAWILGESYSELKSGFPFSQQQWALISQASNSNWFTEVASENIGVVLRQILMYDSQILVALTEMLRAQREQLTAAAMTNTLLVLNNQQNETYLVKDAQGQIPGA